MHDTNMSIGKLKKAYMEYIHVYTTITEYLYYSFTFKMYDKSQVYHNINRGIHHLKYLLLV